MCNALRLEVVKMESIDDLVLFINISLITGSIMPGLGYYFVNRQYF
jgi:hypothetical protein